MPFTTPFTIHLVRSSAKSPKRSELSCAMGLAPMVKISRLIPPTPVAAPWYGSSADGWLCDSILNAHPKPPPKSTRPAFSSPAFASIRGLSLGRVFNQVMEFLYEQCSLHITAKIESSVKLGARPSISFIRSNSSGSKPKSLAVSTVVNSWCSNVFRLFRGSTKLGKKGGKAKGKRQKVKGTVLCLPFTLRLSPFTSYSDSWKFIGIRYLTRTA